MKRFLYVIFVIFILVIISCSNGGGAEDAIEDTSFSIGYNSNGAESGTAPAVQSGSGKAVLAVSANTGSLAKNGYLFDGWNTQPDGYGADYAPGSSYTGKKNITLYAKWARLFNYEVNSISPAPAMEGVQKAPGVPTATITGLTARGRQLSSVNIPESIDGYTVSDIDDNAFQNCDNITDVTVPSTVTSIGNGAFAGCTNLLDMTMLGAVPPIMGTGVFYSCSAIISVPQTAISTYQGAVGWASYSTSIVYIGASTYSIAYDGNGADGGAVPMMRVSTVGGYPVIVDGNTDGLTRAGCTFNNWNTAPDGSGNTYKAGQTIQLSGGRITLYAQWTHPDYVVAFDSQGADTEASPSSIVVKAPANTVVLPEAPIRAGYVFDGWYTETNGQGTQLISSTIIYGNITVYAKWNEGIFQITYNANGANSGTVPSSQKGVTNNNVTISGNTGNLQKTGCKFMGWNTKSDGSGTDYIAGASYAGSKDIILYAKWNNNYLITYLDQGGTVFSGSHGNNHPTLHSYGKDTVLIAPKKAGYIFGGWFSDINCNGNKVDIIKASVMEDIILYAKWIGYSITINNKPHGTVTASLINNIASGTNITLSIFPDPYYKLDSFSITKSNGGAVRYNVVGINSCYTFNMPDENVIINATFTNFNPQYVNLNSLDVGDIILGNGKYVSYSYFNNNRSAYSAISQPVGVVCYKGLSNEYGITGKIYMLGLDQGSSLKWAPSGSSGYSEIFDTSINVGERNWMVIETVDPNGAANASINYPAFNYANTYSKPGYLSGWFLPSRNELIKIYNNKYYIDRGLDAIFAPLIKRLPTNWVWSSSHSHIITQNARQNSGGYYIDFSNGNDNEDSYMYSNYACDVLVVHALDE